MNKKTILTILLIAIAAGTIAFLMIQPQEKQLSIQKPDFQITDFGRAGENAYLTYSSSGEGNAILVGLSQEPKKEIYLLEQKGIGNDNFKQFSETLKQELGKYNLTMRVVGPAAEVKNGIYIVPTGAMPIYVIDKIKNENNVTFIYMGQKDLTISTSIKKYPWYLELSETAKKNLIIKNTTADEMLSKGTIKDLASEIIENRWITISKTEINLSGSRTDTLVFQTNGSKIIRIIYNVQNKYIGFTDKQVPEKKAEMAISKDVYPWENAWVEFSIEKTNGTAYLVVTKDGKQVKNEKLERISEESFFKKSLRFEDSGNYVVKIVDNEGVVATGILHIKKISATLAEIRGTYYHVFNIAIDNAPLKTGKVNVSIKDSNGSSQEFIIANGQVTIPAKLSKGKGTFVFELLGGKVETYVENKQDSIIEVYVKYGPIGIGLVLVIFVIARLNKKQVYSIRVVEAAPEIRKEIKITPNIAEQIFHSARKDLKIDGPVKTHEFIVGLRRYVTDGADVTEGNAEEILKKLGERGLILNWKGYYQLSTEGMIRKNVMRRIIREKLIERGIQFKVNGDRFTTRDFEIGFYGEKFRKKGLIVFEDGEELKSTLKSLNDKERSRLFLKEFNGVINLIQIDKLDEVL